MEGTEHEGGLSPGYNIYEGHSVTSLKVCVKEIDANTDTHTAGVL